MDDAAERQPRSGMAHYKPAPTPTIFFKGSADPACNLSARPKERCGTGAFGVAEGHRVSRHREISRRSTICACSARNTVRCWRPQRSARILKDWLPPKHLRLADASKSLTPADTPFFYTSEMLAHAWIVMADARLRQAQLLDRRTVPSRCRIAATNEALAEVDKSLAVSIWHYQGYVLKAEILLFQSIWTRKTRTFPPPPSMWTKPFVCCAKCPRRRNWEPRRQHADRIVPYK